MLASGMAWQHDQDGPARGGAPPSRARALAAAAVAAPPPLHLQGRGGEHSSRPGSRAGHSGCDGGAGGTYQDHWRRQQQQEQVQGGCRQPLARHRQSRPQSQQGQQDARCGWQPQQAAAPPLTADTAGPEQRPASSRRSYSRGGDRGGGAGSAGNAAGAWGAGGALRQAGLAALSARAHPQAPAKLGGDAQARTPRSGAQGPDGARGTGAAGWPPPAPGGDAQGAGTAPARAVQPLLWVLPATGGRSRGGSYAAVAAAPPGTTGRLGGAAAAAGAPGPATPAGAAGSGGVCGGGDPRLASPWSCRAGSGGGCAGPPSSRGWSAGVGAAAAANPCRAQPPPGSRAGRPSGTPLAPSMAGSLTQEPAPPPPASAAALGEGAGPGSLQGWRGALGSTGSRGASAAPGAAAAAAAAANPRRSSGSEAGGRGRSSGGDAGGPAAGPLLSDYFRPPTAAAPGACELPTGLSGVEPPPGYGGGAGLPRDARCDTAGPSSVHSSLDAAAPLLAGGTATGGLEAAAAPPAVAAAGQARPPSTAGGRPRGWGASQAGSVLDAGWGKAAAGAQVEPLPVLPQGQQQRDALEAPLQHQMWAAACEIDGRPATRSGGAR
jgi:hypothetical protein